MQPTEEQGLSFKKICVDVTEKRILWSVSGEAKPGRILALMGPSGKQRSHNRSYIGATPLSSFDLCFYLPIFSYFLLRIWKDYSFEQSSRLHPDSLRLYHPAWTSHEQEGSSPSQLRPPGRYLLPQPHSEGNSQSK